MEFVGGHIPGRKAGYDPVSRMTRLAITMGAAALIAWQASAATAQDKPPVSPLPESPIAQSREEVLWSEIRSLAREAPLTGNYRDFVADTRARKDALLNNIRGYLAIYPGGSHRDYAFRMELATLFEMGTLAGGQYETLGSRVSEYLENPPCDAARDEAAYWTIVCERLGGPGRNPSSPATALGADHSLIEASLAFSERYRSNRFTPHVLSQVFEAAQRRHDREAMRDVVTRLVSESPQHAVTKLLKARLRRIESAGEPFRLRFEDSRGGQIDTRDYAGHLLLVVVWLGAETEARDCVAEIEAARLGRPSLRVVGVNLDSSLPAMTAACDSLGLSWPQWNDGRGRAGAFVSEWGIRRAPSVFAVDRDSRLIGTAEGPGWRDLLRSALDN